MSIDTSGLAAARPADAGFSEITKLYLAVRVLSCPTSETKTPAGDFPNFVLLVMLINKLVQVFSILHKAQRVALTKKRRKGSGSRFIGITSCCRRRSTICFRNERSV